VQIFFTSHASPHLDVGDPQLNELGGQLITETDPAKRDELLSQMFTRIFDTYAHLPMGTVPASVVVNSELVDGWSFPGATSSGLSHYHLITLK